MMKTKLTLFVTVLAAALFMGGCASVPKPDVAHAVKWKGHWYAVLKEKCDWETAKKRCEELGGHLAFMETEVENNYIRGIVGNSFADKDLNLDEDQLWLGGTDEKKEGEWVWLNGSQIQAPFWYQATKEPNNLNGNEHYLSIILFAPAGTDNWNDSLPTKNYYPVCEWE